MGPAFSLPSEAALPAHCFVHGMASHGFDKRFLLSKEMNGEFSFYSGFAQDEVNVEDVSD